MSTFLTLSTFLALYNVPSPSSAELIEFGFLTNAGTSGNQDDVPVIATVWFDDKIYQASLEPININTWYLAHKDNNPKFTLLGLSDCTQNNNGDTKMMLESNSFDSLRIQQMKIVTDSAWYGVDSIMVNDVEVTNPCLSNDPNDCIIADTGGIYKQMFYFDTSQPDKYITGAQWSDAMDMYPDQEIQTCDPSHDPSTNPTRSPTMNPTSLPTLIPTLIPTRSPTLIPTNSPTLIPTSSPTRIPSESTTGPSHSTTIAIVPSVRSTVRSSTQISLSASVTSTVYEDDQSDDTKNRRPVQNMMWPYGVIFIAIGACCVVLLLWYCCRYKTHKRREAETIHKEEPRSAGHDGAGSHDWMQLWLDESVGLPQYVDNFVQNGYSDVDTVSSITDKQQLIEIGIHKRGHQTLLMAEIEKLKPTNKKGRPDAVIPVRVVEHRKANEELLEGNTKGGSSAMISVQSLANSVAVDRVSGDVFGEESVSNREMGQEDDIIMDDLCMDDKENVTNGGMANDEFIVEEDYPCTLRDPTAM
eukprot:94183_1